jgi:hypothetical protein
MCVGEQTGMEMFCRVVLVWRSPEPRLGSVAAGQAGVLMQRWMNGVSDLYGSAMVWRC